MTINMDDFPEARPVTPVSIAPPVARTRHARSYPEIVMPRLLAAIDLLLIIGAFLLFQDLLAFSGLARYFHERFPELGIFSVNILLGAAFLPTIYGFLAYRGQSWSAIGLGRTSGIRVLAGTLIAVPLCYAAVLIAVPLFMSLIGMSMEDMMRERGEFFDMVPQMPRWLVPLVAVFVGLHEEALFRGFILSRLRALCGSTIAAVLISTLIFGILHAYQGMIGVVQTGTVGLVLAVVAVRSRSIWPAILAHGIFNTIGLTLIPWVQENFGDLLKEMSTTSSPM